MKLLVTGGAGRLGSEVVKLATEKGHAVVAFDLPQAHWEAISGVSGVEIFEGDITKAESAEEACRGVEGVIHLAAILPPVSERDRAMTLRVNVGGTRNLVEALNEIPDVPMVLASSVSTYGITVGRSLRSGRTTHSMSTTPTLKVR